MNPISRTLLKVLLLASGLMLFGIAHAEGNCPDGYYPIGTPDGQVGPQGCAPYPGNDPAYQHAPQQRWADQWGAIATDSIKGVVSTATNLASKEQASQTVMADCEAKGGAQCIFQIAYRNECVAMVLGNAAFNIKPGKTVNEATESGIKTCNSGGGPNCHVYYSACSLPKRIQ